MTALALLFRLLVTLATLWVMVRVTGKRELGDTGPMDLITALVLGLLAGEVALGRAGLVEGVAALGALLWLHLLVTTLSGRWQRLRERLWGHPATLVRWGRLQQDSLYRHAITDLQAESLAREGGAAHLGEVRELTLLPDGSSVVTLRAGARPVTVADVQVRHGGKEEPWQRAA